MRALETQQPPDNLSTWLAVDEAVMQIDQVHQSEMKLALKKLRQQMEKDKAKELLYQQQVKSDCWYNYRLALGSPTAE